MVFSLALSSSTERPVRSGTVGFGAMAHFAAIFSMREFTTFALEYSMETVGAAISSDSSARLMIHNPMTAAFGNSEEMQRTIEMLGSVKDSIINAYEIKTGLSRAKLSRLMDAETWMDANKAVELGFADGIMSRADEAEDMAAPTVSMLYSKANVVCAIDPKPAVPERTGRSVDELRAKLNTIKNYI